MRFFGVYHRKKCIMQFFFLKLHGRTQQIKTFILLMVIPFSIFNIIKYYMLVIFLCFRCLSNGLSWKWEEITKRWVLFFFYCKKKYKLYWYSKFFPITIWDEWHLSPLVFQTNIYINSRNKRGTTFSLSSISTDSLQVKWMPGIHLIMGK